MYDVDTGWWMVDSSWWIMWIVLGEWLDGWWIVVGG